MTELDVHVQGPGPTFVGQTQFFYFGDDFVEVVPVPADSLAACEEWRFVSPGGDWTSAETMLREHRVLVLVGEPGTGRRTAALWLLGRFCAKDRILDLDPVWARPRPQLLPPATGGCGYLLDMTEETEEPITESFGTQVREWVRNNEHHLIITTTASVAAGQWTEGVRPAVAWVSSPDARLLVERELRAANAGSRVPILGEAEMAPIWDSRPKAEDAVRLAKIIVDAPDADPQQVANEYGDWRNWIEEHLPAGIGDRALLWSCAFCDGGQRKSVLRMAENLRRTLGQSRTPADILADTPASKRLDAAGIKREGDRVRLSPEQHGLPFAVRRHLWDEFEDQIEVLTSWIVKEVTTLPVDDASRVLDAILDLVIQYRDDGLLRRLRDALARERRALAVDALSRAVLDPRFGKHVRGRLYTWLARQPSQATIDVVAAVCGGRFGEEQPTMALVRLRHAARASAPSSPALAEALAALARRHPTQVVDTINEWLRLPSETAGVKAFLALASNRFGAQLLCGKVANPGARSPEGLAHHFRAALSDPATRDLASDVLEAWKDFAEQGVLDYETAIKVAGVAFSPWIQDNIMRRFLPNDSLDMKSYWGRVLKCAIQTGEAHAQQT